MFKALTSADAQVQSCQLSDPEVRGLVGELITDQNGEVAYKDFVQTWVPVLFELRKIKMYEPYLTKEPFMNPGLTSPDLSQYEVEFPVLPPEMIQLGERRGSRRLSKGSKNSSKELDETTTVKRSRLKQGNTRGTTRDSMSGSSHVMGTIKLGANKRSSMSDLERGGSKRSSMDG